MFGVMLQIASLNFGNILQQLEDLGFFRYILPFLLIFAVVFAILKQIKIFEDNTGASVLIAVSIGLLALQLNFVSVFFQDFFPKVGVGIAILVVALILAGGFISGNDKLFSWVFLLVGGAIFFLILVLTFSGTNFVGNFWWNEYGTLVIVALVIIVAIVMVIVVSKRKATTT